MHKSVLLEEAVEGLGLKGEETVVDATYGAGGHTKEIQRRFPHVRVVSIDRDPGAGASIIGNFRNIGTLLPDVRPDAILFDLGFSSDQLVGKGMSFMKDEPLDMR